MLNEWHRSFSSFEKFKLRPYQQECIDSCVNELDNGPRRIAVSLPTGAGKTVIFTHLIDQVKSLPGQGNQTIILVHRRELAFQAAETCKRTFPDKLVQVEMGDFKADPNADIIIASVQTLITGRYKNFNPDDFKMVVIDECHHAAADSYRQVLNYFNINDADSKIALVGFSATLRREDEKNLDETFDKIAFHLDLEKLIFDKHLVDAKFTTVTLSNADLGKVKTNRGDFVISGLAAAVNNKENNDTILGTYLHFVKNHNIKSTMLFGVNIEHVQTLGDVFKSNGVSAEYVTSKTKKDLRLKAIEDFKNGKISVLMNCGIFTEGTDMPNIDCILLARPTKSKTLLVQMIGRGLRLHASKEFCHIVDFVGINNSSVVTVPSLRNLPTSFQSNELSFKEMDDMKIKLDELEKINELNKLEKEKEDLKKTELKEISNLAKTQELLNSHLKPEFESDYNSKNLELTTFESIRDFIKSKNGKEPDFVQILKSDYPWVRGPTKYVWILDCPPHSHFRLEVHPNGLKKGFFNDVGIGNIYFNQKDISELNERLYTLSFYQEKKSFIYRNHFYENRWDANLACPISVQIKEPLDYIDQLYRYKTKTSHKDITKFALWRKEVATEKQIKSIKAIASRALTKEEMLILEDKVNELTRGQVSNALFAYGIFRKKGLKPALPKESYTIV